MNDKTIPNQSNKWFKKVTVMEKIIRTKVKCFVFVFSIALICEANEIERETLKTSNSTYLEIEDKAIELLEETLSHLKERKKQIGKISYVRVIQKRDNILYLFW